MMMLFLAIFATLILCVFLTVQYSLFLPPVKGLPILMYHKVSPEATDYLTVSLPQLESHFEYLAKNGYSCLPLGRFHEMEKSKLPSKVFALTFDDAYVNNLEFLYPLLQKYSFHASIMLPVGYLGKTNEWDGGGDKLMDYAQLLSMDGKYISFGLHTFGHIPLKSTPLAEIAEDLEKCKQTLAENGIDYLPFLAYPYGGFPKDPEKKQAFFEVLEKAGIRYGLRIGNKINAWPIKNRYEIKRIDIRGDESFWRFKTKLKKGRVKMF